MKQINISIPIETLCMMPEGKILGAFEIQDMDYKPRQVLKIKWKDTEHLSDVQYRSRVSLFAIDDGSYQGESCLDESY